MPDANSAQVPGSGTELGACVVMLSVDDRIAPELNCVESKRVPPGPWNVRCTVALPPVKDAKFVRENVNTL